MPPPDAFFPCYLVEELSLSEYSGKTDSSIRRSTRIPEGYLPLERDQKFQFSSNRYKSVDHLQTRESMRDEQMFTVPYGKGHSVWNKRLIYWHGHIRRYYY